MSTPANRDPRVDQAALSDQDLVDLVCAVETQIVKSVEVR